MPWIGRKVLEGMQRTEQRLWRENSRLHRLCLRLSGDKARLAVNEEQQMEGLLDEAHARADATRSEGDAALHARRNGPHPDDIDLNYDETQEIGGER